MQRLVPSLRGRPIFFSSTFTPSRLWNLRGISQTEEERQEIPRMPPFEYVPLPYDGPRAEEILKKRFEFLSPSIVHFYKKPVRFLAH